MKKFYQLHNKSLSKHKVDNYKELWDKLKAKGYKGMTIQMKTEFKKSSKDETKYHAIFSTNSVDRHGDIVEQNWKLKNFKNNPVYLDSHDYSSIESIIGKIVNPKVKDGKLIGDIIFATENPRGQLAKDLAEGGFLNASSVGFIPLKFDDKFEKIIESELLEISAVSIPANPEATYEKNVNNKTKRKEVKETEGDGANDNNTENKTSDDTECDDNKEGQKILTPQDRIKNAIKKEIEIREKAINKVLTAVKFIEASTKGRDSVRNNEAINNKLNKAVKTLLKIKKIK